ncbi:hypothetical protein D3C87_1435710 [compost metagenome]
MLRLWRSCSRPPMARVEPAGSSTEVFTSRRDRAPPVWTSDTLVSTARPIAPFERTTGEKFSSTP